MENHEFNTIVSRVETFYSKLFFQITGVISIIIGLIGVAIPWASSLYQQQSFEERKALIEMQLRNEMNDRMAAERAKMETLITENFAKMEALLAENSMKMEEKYKASEKNLTAANSSTIEQANKIISDLKKEATSRTWAGIYMLRADSFISSNQFGDAFLDQIRAANYFLLLGEIRNMQVTLNKARLITLPKLNRTSIENLAEIESEFTELIKNLKERDKAGEHSLIIENLEADFKSAKQRK